MFKIPFHTPQITGDELDCLRESLKFGHWSGDGPFTKKCEVLLEKMMQSRVFLTPSGTHALELAVMSLGLSPGDEVILPSFTFVSTANALVLNALRPVFIDVRPDTLNMDEALVEQAISERTKAVLPVHYAGVVANMDAIVGTARKHGLSVIEDAAQAVNSYYDSKAAGTIGDFGCYSFHQTKNFSCGEGGALIVSNEKYRETVEIHREKGTNRSQFLQGRIDKYTWIDRGSSYLLSDLLAAFLYPQLLKMDEITRQREHLYLNYEERLSRLAPARFQLPTIPSNCRPNYHIFFLILDSASTREKFIAHMREKGVEVVSHFVPLHSSPAGKKFGTVRGKMDVTDRIADRLVRLPLYPQMTIETQGYVIEAIGSFFT